MRSLVPWLAVALTAAPALADDDFEKHVRPLLVEHCLGCHGPTKQAGGLRLDSREALLLGGDSGPAAVEGDPEESLLVQAVGYEDLPRMPPKDRLPDDRVERIREWVRRGLPWPSAPAEPADAPLAEAAQPAPLESWWSFRPLRPVAPPRVEDDAWCRTEVDRFILAGLEAKGLTPSGPADRRALIRRATYDLTGLPPTPEEVDAFLADVRPDAFARVVERLLASPRYGEHWGRHWLDVARYADTAGENTDHPVADAWRYRNWVIGAFNRDMPYDEFVRQQVAGDILAEEGPEGEYGDRLAATGFLAVARRFDHDIEKSMHLTYEDAIDTIGKAFLGLSIGCARCHDHKYDPIGARDYYALYGILQSSRFPFPGCEPDPLPRDLSPMLSPQARTRRAERLPAELAALEAEAARIGEARSTLAARANPDVVRLLASGEIPDGGSRELAGSPGDPAVGIEVRVGEALRLSIAPLASHGADSTLLQWEIVEVDGPGRWDLAADVIEDFLGSNPRPDRSGNPGVWCFLDGRGGPRLLGEAGRDLQGAEGLHSWQNGDAPSVFANTGREPIRVWTELPPRSVFAHPAPDGPAIIAWVSPIAGEVRLSGRVSDAHPGGPDGVSWALDHLTHDVAADLRELASIEARSAEVARRREHLERVETAYAVTEGTPGDARLHLRGDPEKLGPVVPRRWLGLFGGEAVPPGGGSGRRQLAGWLTDRSNPLTARVMANRVWQHHFGKGLVKTPNDFGTRGQLPTHPELLDWLAAQFVQDGWSVKALHRRIMLSSTYQQAVAVRPEAATADPVNDLYWRFDRRRLAAEELRDSLLMASGRIDSSPGGPHPFPPPSRWTYTQHTPFAEDYETDRRSVYLMTLRNRRPAFFALFDGADPNATTPLRQVTTVPTQALFFMNDPFFHAQAEGVARRVLERPDDASRLDELYRIVFQRPATARDRETALAFLAAYPDGPAGTPKGGHSGGAWSALVRILMSSNEFLYVE